MGNIFFLDTETTSKDSTQARVVEIAMISSDGVEEIDGKIKPPTPITIGAMATHHITEKMLQDKPPFYDSYAHYKLSEYIDRGDILVAHNAPYDIAVLANEGVVIERYIDTLRVARHILTDPSIESYSLQYLRYFYDLDSRHEGELTDGFAHSALYDTRVLKWLYQFLEEQIFLLFPQKNSEEYMLELTNTPVLIQTFKFGKHVGKTIEEVYRTSPDYLEWLLGSESKKPEHEQNEDMIYTLKYWLNK